jgi:hypothetical protein
MARKIIDIGIVGNDGTGDSIRDSFRKVNENFRELYSSLGLGEKLTLGALDDLRLNGDTPSYKDLNPNNPFLGYENKILSVNSDESGVALKEIRGDAGVNVDFTPESIIISSEFSALVNDPEPRLGGNLSVRSFLQHRIINMGTDLNPLFPIYNHEATSKGYVDTKISRSGTESIDPATGEVNTAFGTMTGPLILARDPRPDDDEIYDGLIAATKRYVDNSGFGSRVNLYVATSGEDDRVGVSSDLQGRALPYAYKTFEAALKKAEELVLESRQEIGPYKKVLTYNDGANFCILEDIDPAPGSGVGFIGQAFCSVDEFTIQNPGQNYTVGDVITVQGGTGTAQARFEVLSVGALPGTSKGPILSLRLLSSGVYSVVPPQVDGATTTSVNSPPGVNCTLNLTYKVNNVTVTNGGSGYGLVSVRITGGGGTGAFGTADVVGGVVQSITVTDPGSGFTATPTVEVSLPRFLLKTEGQRTDFTGDVTTNTQAAIRGRDIREGLFLRGEESGALAQILSHSGALDSEGNEIFDVDIKYGTFITTEDRPAIGGERISYGDVAKEIQITILVESGIYYENLPLKVPANVSIVGDEFRRIIIRPKPGVSSSPWAFTYFRRDLTIGGPALSQQVYDSIDEIWETENIAADTLVIANRLFGYHYLTNSANPIYPLVNNKGAYKSSAELLRLNRQFLQKEVIAWIQYQIDERIPPFDDEPDFSFNINICERDIGLILDSMIFDLKWGGSDRTISAGLKYFGSATNIGDPAIVLEEQLSETVAAVRRLQMLTQFVIKNIEITELYQLVVPQIIDNAFIAESGVGGTIVNIQNISQTNPVVITTAANHNLVEGANILINGVGGAVELNGNDFFVSIVSPTSFEIFNDAGLADGVSDLTISNYTSGGVVRNAGGPSGLGGVLGDLFEAFIDVIEGSGVVNIPKNNDEMDMFLCNDAVRLQAITGQGHGGFMMVLDPAGQILSRSPYAQECASFSKSTGRQTFAGGMYIDGFTGNIKFQILSKDSNTFLRVGGLVRFPQLPASFIVNDNVYRINYVRDFTFNTAGSTASFVLDEATPWPFALFTYNDDICYRDVGLIIEGLGYDIVLDTNYNTRKSALSYRQANASVVIDTQLDLTARGITQAHLAALSVLAPYPEVLPDVEYSERVINDVVRNGAVFAPALTMTNPPGVASNLANAKALILSNIRFIQEETIGYIADNYPVYDREQFYKDTNFVIDSILNDLVLGSNYQSVTAGLAYRRNITVYTDIIANLKAEVIAGLNEARDLILDLITDAGAEAIITANFLIVTDIIDTGSGAAPALTYTVPGSLDSGYVNAVALLASNRTFLQDELVAWIANEISTAGPSSIWNGFVYNPVTCARDVGYIVDALRYDILYGGNSSSVSAGRAYYNGAVITGQIDQTVAAYEHLKELIEDVVQNVSVVPVYGATPQVSGTAGSSAAAAEMTGLVDSINQIIQGTFVNTVNPVYSRGTPAYASVRIDVQDDKETIVQDSLDYLEDNNLVFAYDDVKCRRDIGYILEGLAYDVIYGGNSQSVDSGQKYYSSIISGFPSQIPNEQKAVTLDALAYVKYLARQVIVNAPPAVSYTAEPQITGAASDAGTQTVVGDLVDITINIVDNGYTSAPTVVYPNLNAYVYSATAKLARTALLTAKEDIQETVITFVDENANVYEVLMPGNRSMLSNDYTQINDMGYGVIVNNGGLAECVSMFTYYNYISYYSLNGGQIRSVGGSSAHGVYALVAEGADPLEVPTPVTLYYDLSQGADCYFPSGVYANIQGGQEIYVTNYDYVPLDSSEIEIDHGSGSLFRYPVTTVSTSGLPAGVAKLNLNSAEGVGVEGLFAQVPNGTKLTLRQASQTVLTGDVVEVATRPSTGLVLRESPTVYRILQFQEYVEPAGARSVTISVGATTYINRNDHGLLPGYQIALQTTGLLPSGLIAGEIYYVIPDGFTEDRFAISATKNGLPISTTGTQAGAQSYLVKGLARTTLRENYDYVDLTVWPLQPYATSGVDTCTISVGNPAVITQVNHNLSAGEVIKFEVAPGGSMPGGISDTRHYFVKNVLGADTFTITDEAIPAAVEVATVSAGSGTFGVGKVIGKLGDDQIAVVPVGPGDADRILGTKFNFKGVTYSIIQYQNEAATLEAYALITLDKPLEDSAVYFTTLPAFKAGVPVNEPGTLTIRISLTRVTSHDLLEIGTGSYADTNYPNEIFGPAVNPLNPSNETQERDVGRVFYVTTDQFGNFSVGPYFKVDQGTGTVTFSAAIALSNLDGIGFKRGVPISEFSTDSSFSDNATDTVPTENATRTYIDRRLGLNHNGNIVPDANVIPTLTGGFMSLDGQLAMKGQMNLANNKIVNVGDPTTAKDAVNLQSLTFLNFQETTITGLAASDILAFTGTGNQAINATMTGDISLTVNAGLNEINAQINPNTVINADVKSDAAIAQSKLGMNLATTAASAPPNTPVAATSLVAGRRYRILVPGSTSWTSVGSANNLAGTIFQATTTGSGSGTAVELDAIQAGSGVASFKSTEFTITNGWVELQTATSASTGIDPSKLQHINSETVLGRSAAGVGQVVAVNMYDVVENGLGIQKDQYSGGTGYLRRNGFGYEDDTDYQIVDHSTGIFSVDGDYGPSELVIRNSSGDFGGRNVDVSRLLIDGKTTIDTVVQSVPLNSGYTQYHGYLGQVGILIGDGTTTANKVSFYDNESHVFRNQSGLANAPVTVSTLTATAITTGGASTAGSVTGNWSLTTGSRLQATYADLAEYYEADQEYPVGTVLIFGGDREVTVSSISGDHRVAGVVSDNAAYIMNSECPGTKAMIALQGRVKCRVVGKISKGDLIITSNIKGVAISAKSEARPGTIIGKALENYDSDHIGTIEVAVGRT